MNSELMKLNGYLRRHPEYGKHPERLERLNRSFKKARYGITEQKNFYMYKKDDGYGELKDATNVIIRDILDMPNEEIIFYYDPEINWTFKLKLENIKKGRQLYTGDYPQALEGEGYGIIENCGSIQKLQKLREDLKAKDWKNFTDYKYYYTFKQSNKLNLDLFVVDDMTFRLRKLWKVVRKYYEGKPYLSTKIHKVLKRKYRVYRKNKPIY